MQCDDGRRAVKLPTHRRSHRDLAFVGSRLVFAAVFGFAAMMSSPSSFVAEFPGNHGVPNPPDPPPTSADSQPVVAPFRPFRFKLNVGTEGICEESHICTYSKYPSSDPY